MSATLRILRAGPGASVQDKGRRGFLRFGVTPAGPMDSGGFIAALLAAGDTKGAAIEASLGGLELAAEGGEIGLAIAGGAFDIRLDERALPPACAFKLVPGARLIRAGGRGGRLGLYRAVRALRFAFGSRLPRDPCALRARRVGGADAARRRRAKNCRSAPGAG